MIKSNFPALLGKISILQILISALISIIYVFLEKTDIALGFILAGLASSCYTQLIAFSSRSKFLALFGFPVRILIVGLPVAILVHKTSCSLIALFLGFVITLTIYMYIIWVNAKKIGF